MSLVTCLSSVKDPRRLQGQRYSSVAVLIIVIMAILRGKYGYREIGRFCQLNKTALLDRFDFKNKCLPSHVSICTFMRADFSSIQKSFHQWTQSYVPIEEGEWISIDGKSIPSTVSDYSSEYQNFVSLVSLFCSKREQVLHVERLENKKGNESQVVEELFDLLDLKGVVFTLHALHCKKNAKKNSKKR